jgi:hypothetical protein
MTNRIIRMKDGVIVGDEAPVGNGAPSATAARH